MDKSLFQNQVAKVCDEIMHHTESNWFLLRFPDLAVEVVIDHEERTRAFNVLTNAEAKGSNGKRHEFNVSIWGTFASIENTRVEHCDPGFKFRGRGFYFVDLNGV